jgi:SAM-dependent methyltransferase
MEPEEYRRLFSLEPTYWWFRGLRLILEDVLRSAGAGAGARVLDAGCGTGETLRDLGGRLSARTFGFDLSREAASYWPRRGLSRMSLASLHDVPYPDGVFDGVLCVDALESDGVDDFRAYAELWRVTKPGGIIVLMVPAYSWLRTEGHHRAVRAFRRYTLPQARRLLRSRPIELIRITHLFGFLFPVIAAVRCSLRSLWGRPARPRSELVPLPRLLNEALFAVMRLERRFVRSWDLPLGSSILAVARRGPRT